MIKRILISIFIVIILIISVGVYVFYTSRGAELAARLALSPFVEEEIEMEKADGNMAEGIVFRDVTLHNLKWLPSDNYLKIQYLSVQANSLKIDDVQMKFENCRLKIPDSDPIVLTGAINNGQMDLNIYSSGFIVADVQELIPSLGPHHVYAAIEDVDIFIKGTIEHPVVSGSFKVEKFIYDMVTVTGSLGHLDFNIYRKALPAKVSGKVELTEGEVKAKRAAIKINRADVEMSRSSFKPMYSFSGDSRVGTTRINVKVDGEGSDYKLSLTSDPPRSQEQLLIMLATGNEINFAKDGSLVNGESADLIKSAVDYFIFGNKTSEFARKLGINDLAITYDKNKKGVAAKTSLTNTLEVGYGVEQETDQNNVSSVKQNLSGEVKLTDKLSVTAEKEFKKQSEIDNQIDQQIQAIPDDKVYLKYKTKF